MYRAHRGTSGGDSLSEARWYRVTGQAGSRLLSEPPNPDVSGTFACAYHDGWLRTQHPHPNAPLADAVVCFTVALPIPLTLPPHLPPSPFCPRHPTAAYPLPRPTPAPLFPSPGTSACIPPEPHSCTSQLHLSLHLPCTSPAPHLHITCISRTSPVPHPHLTLALRPAVRQTADYPSTPVRGREAIDSCDQQVVVMRGSSELEVVAGIVCGGGRQW